ncbi:hypothetical protein [Prauserella endophytica]|uniref:Uncharacterized protein n=1 Tax=Prauserella endophytica TaxID=1592324 RepID=A0ABY2S066_9PSEU|nr:hypothetical protein [Prauserella endophytica]PXY20337.1 hypothetical protein BAY59_31360 [Prauserella coralliicola]TKG66939.1 hypothetical protein FCN18_23805 [Prauserella endophytica]
METVTDPRATLDAYAYEDAPKLGSDPAPDREDYAMRAFAALRAVLDLHKRSDEEEGDPLTVMYGHVCVECSDEHAVKNSHAQGIVLWPCPSVQAITTALGAK